MNPVQDHFPGPGAALLISLTAVLLAWALVAIVRCAGQAPVAIPISDSEPEP